MQNARITDLIILLLLALAAVILINLFIESLQHSREIKEELKTKTSISK